MKRLPQLLLCLLASVSAVPAMADWHGRGGWNGGGGYYGGHHGGGNGYRGGWGRNWVGPAVGAAFLGGAIYAASTNSYAQPPQVVVVQPEPYAVQPQVVVAPQPYAVGPRVAYFCSTAQVYYPRVPTCPVPWQVVNY